MAAFTTIDDPEAHYQTVGYTGNGTADKAITLPGTTAMAPDFVWIKNRDATDNHVLTDAVRGATETLFPNDSGATATVAEGLKSFDSDGYTVGTDVRWNTSTEDYASWNWKMGTTSGLSGGSLTPDGYSFSATAGQGIYEYTGGGSAVTISHGLGAVPKLMIGKRSENDAQEWRVYHATPGPTKNLVLDQNDAANTTIINWNNTAPTSTVFTVGTSLTESSKVMMTYVFADVQGFSKFGQYEGNGNADGTFVYTGFQPEFIIQKDIDATRSWGMFYRLSEADLGNPIDNYLHCDTTASEAESASNGIDFLSNGFKCRGAGAVINTTSTYVYAAWARAPFVNSNGVPGNAR